VSEFMLCERNSDLGEDTLFVGAFASSCFVEENLTPCSPCNRRLAAYHLPATVQYSSLPATPILPFLLPKKYPTTSHDGLQRRSHTIRLSFSTLYPSSHSSSQIPVRNCPAQRKADENATGKHIHQKSSISTVVNALCFAHSVGHSQPALGKVSSIHLLY